jgi:hypothetical protein
MRPRQKRSLAATCIATVPAAAIPQADIWRAALAMVWRYGADAMLEAATRAY